MSDKGDKVYTQDEMDEAIAREDTNRRIGALEKSVDGLTDRVGQLCDEVTSGGRKIDRIRHEVKDEIEKDFVTVPRFEDAVSSIGDKIEAQGASQKKALRAQWRQLLAALAGMAFVFAAISWGMQSYVAYLKLTEEPIDPPSVERVRGR